MNDDRAREGVEHLQTAAVEVIAAVRAFLDVAEDLVRDPASATALVTSLTDAARAAATPASPPADADSDTGRVTRIRVS